ncbi:bifunctional lysylphosphatidylglycerol synthetase/lysine--tRNA ligase LysX [Nakamurella endophytica]|uniref:bifunctional lysylphosphatidylglycerol synthetase/lysine--tRNA ligase LysX n=1 Tax=Nakamurella endophytica TaxID=1748367 RepID=UPI001669561A|nr:bifunctional lysylphosphatidylglycerol synthetase/lysine--tRNA ligase LysX [Nakamurella endophytica]
MATQVRRHPVGSAERVARWTVVVYVVASLFTVLDLPHRIGAREFDPLDAVADTLNLPVLHNVLGVLIMFLLTGALVRRKRFALWIVLATQLLGVVWALVVLARAATGHWFWFPRPAPSPSVGDAVLTYLGGVVGAVLAVVLWSARSAFPARRSPGSRRAALLVLLAGGALSVGVAIAVTQWQLPDVRHPWVRVVEAVRAALGLDSLLPRPAGAPRLPPWAVSLTSTLSALVLIAAVAVFLRSGRAPAAGDAGTELAVRRLLATSRHQDSLGYFATRRDKSVLFAPDGRAAVSYRVLASVCLASADPLGDPRDWPAAIREWLQQARRYGWVPAAISVGREAAQAYVAAGFRAIPLGDEAILDLPSFSLAGPRMKPVRQAVHRIERAGFTVSIRRHRDVDPAELAQLAELADRWRGDAPERGFSMALSRLGDPVDGDCLMVVGHRADGRPAGVLSFVPWGPSAVSLDLMRRAPDAPNGLLEAMVVALVQRHVDVGVRRVSLNFAMFRGVFAAAEELGAGPVVRLNNAVLGVFSRFFQLESLYRSNAKYRPSWVPRYLCIDSPLSLPRVAVAAGMAEGFLPAGGAAAAPVSEGALIAAVAELAARTAVSAAPVRRLRDQERIRRQHLARLREAGMDPYPVAVPRTADLAELRHRPHGSPVSAVGRVEAVRDLGGVLFADLRDGDARLQLVLDRALTGPDSMGLWRRGVDRGDIVSATGVVGASRTGEPSLLVDRWGTAAKSLRPLPPARQGLRDPETRLRDRSADLLVNRDAARMIRRRSTAVAALRDAFRSRGFDEVETPILNAVHGGASAAPFRTHINAYHRDLSLRIAPELYLKRLVVGGSGPVFEIGRNFRNEGADGTHNPEFTSVEAYLPFADYLRMRDITADVVREVAEAVNGAPVAIRTGPAGERTTVDLSGPWRTQTVHRAVGLACGCDVTVETPVAALQDLARRRGVAVSERASAGELVTALYEHLVEPATWEPTFFTDFPVETSPLTRTHRRDARLAERWDLVAFGMEIGTAYSELTDPVEQRARLTAQSLRAAAGDEEAMELDEDFLAALELGMPPTGGLGLGVDRIVMMLTGSTIREVLAFPFVRPVPS